MGFSFAIIYVFLRRYLVCDEMQISMLVEIEIKSEEMQLRIRKMQSKGRPKG